MLLSSHEDRHYAALLALQRGDGIDLVAAGLPNHKAGLTAGVSARTASRAVNAGLTALLGGALRGRRPVGLPDELWPPPDVRAAISALTGGGRLTRRTQLAALRRWIEAGPAPPMRW